MGTTSRSANGFSPFPIRFQTLWDPWFRRDFMIAGCAASPAFCSKHPIFRLVPTGSLFTPTDPAQLVSLSSSSRSRTDLRAWLAVPAAS